MRNYRRTTAGRCIVAAALMGLCAGCSRSTQSNDSGSSATEVTSTTNEPSLRILDTIGSDSSADYIFSRIDDIEITNSGELIVLDRGARTIRVFAPPHYSLVTQFAIVPGEGPGEFQDIYSMSLSPAGDRLAVTFSYGVALLDREFSEIGRSRIPGSPTPTVSFAAPDTIVIMHFPRTMTAECCLFDVYAVDGMRHVRSFGTRHETYNGFIDRGFSSGFANVYMDIAGERLVMAFGYPAEVRTYNWHDGTLADKFAGDLPYFADEYEHPTIKSPMHRGLVGGLFLDEAGDIHVFESDRYPPQDVSVDYLSSYTSAGLLYSRINLTDRLGLGFPRLNSGRKIDGDVLVVEMQDPVPGIAVLALDRD